MTKKIQRLLQITFFAVMGSLLLINCEPDADNLGSQFFQKNAAQDSVVLKDLIAYNINNNDELRSDGSKLDSATIGAVSVPQFGLQKASYFTQIRLSQYDPNFGVNAVADSAVLVIKPRFASDSIKTTTDANYTYPIGNVLSTKVVNTYPVIFKYGRTKIDGATKLTINVNEVTEYMGSIADSLFSNQNFTEGALLGSKVFLGNISSYSIKSNLDNAELQKRDASIRIPLDGTFFQNKIISKQGLPVLSDASTFIRYFKGLKISVAENDGYLLKFNPNDVELILYYKNDVTTNGVTTRPQSIYSFNLDGNKSANGFNVHFQKIKYNRAGTALESALATSNSNAGDAKIFAQGMGGPSVGIKIPDAAVVSLKDLYKNQKAGILSAKIRLYADTSAVNKFSKPKFFTVQQKNVSTFLSEFSTYSANTSYVFITVEDLFKNSTSYDLDVTKTIKDIIETEAPNKDFVLNVGSYTIGAAGGYEGNQPGNTGSAQYYNSRAYTPNAVVLVGTDPSSNKRAQLRIIYSTK